MPKQPWRYDHLTWPEMKAAIGRTPQPVVAIPIGAVEDHGAHMSLSTDNDILEGVLAECGRTVEEVDVYVPHQANVRIIDYATQKLGIPEDRVVIDVDRYGNTSSGSIPLALADAKADGRLEAGRLVLMTGMGAGLTWGSGLIEWTDGGRT